MKKNIQWGIAVCHFTLIKRVTHKIRIELFFKLVQIVQVQYYLISMCNAIEGTVNINKSFCHLKKKYKNR